MTLKKNARSLTIPRMLLSCCTLSVLAGCSSLAPSISSSIDKDTLNPLVAATFQQDTKVAPAKSSAVITSVLISNPDSKKMKDGLGLNSNTALTQAIAQALIDNHQIKEQQALLIQAEQQAIITTADQGFNLSLASTYSKRTNGITSSPSSAADLAIKGSFQPDLWGNLNAHKKAVYVQVAQAKANLQRSKNVLIADITAAWYQLVYQQKLYTLTQSQEDNTQAQLAAIESSYNQGLSQSLDVYLARSNLKTARGNTVAMQQALSSASRKLEILFAAYPSGKLIIKGELTSLLDHEQRSIPSDIIKNRDDLNSRWLAVLGQDATVAARYAEQFPQFVLTGNLSLTAVRLSELFKQNLAWSLLATVNQSLFDNGKKKAIYKQSQAKLVEKEQQYLQALQNAFSQIENLLETEKSISQRAKLNQLALKDTQLSYEQVNVQYQNGIANYQQVLSVQQQLFEKQKSQLAFKMDLIDNRVALLLALGTKHIPQNTTESK